VKVKIIFGNQTEERKKLAYQLLHNFLLQVAEVNREQTKRR
jgi:hypothetical protein